MNEERKAELSEQYITRTAITKEDCSSLEIQELIFLLHAAKGCIAKGTGSRDDFEEKIQIYLSAVHDKIKHAEELYIAYDQKTNYPYIDHDGRIWIFSKEEYALRAQDYFLQQFLQLEMRKISQEENTRVFADLHRLGMKKLLVDNGENFVEVERDEILPPPDWSDTPAINIPITNPDLQHSMIHFFQNLYSGNNYEGKKQYLYELEGVMIDEVIEGKYLIPMKLIENGESSEPDEQGMRTLQQGATIQFACLVSENNTSWLPAFTDWVEFEKAYDKSEWGGNIATYEDLMAVSEKMDGIVVNCRGIAFSIPDNNKKKIDEFRRQKTEPQPAGIQQHVVEKGTKVLLGEPKEYPEQMINAVSQFMKKQKRIKKAYLRLMVKENERSFLIIVDYEGSKDDLFPGIAEVAEPYLHGMPLDLTGMADWVMSSVQSIQPFYKKKRFGIF